MSDCNHHCCNASTTDPELQASRDQLAALLHPEFVAGLRAIARRYDDLLARLDTLKEVSSDSPGHG